MSLKHLKLKIIYNFTSFTEDFMVTTSRGKMILLWYFCPVHIHLPAGALSPKNNREKTCKYNQINPFMHVTFTL